jgi:hypothetical protein
VNAFKELCQKPRCEHKAALGFDACWHCYHSALQGPTIPPEVGMERLMRQLWNRLGPDQPKG